jgi:hypothetical protein
LQQASFGDIHAIKKQRNRYITINDTDKKKTRKLNPLIKIGLALIAISGIIFAYEAALKYLLKEDGHKVEQQNTGDIDKIKLM